MEKIPNEIICTISWYLSKADAKNFGLTCKRIHGCMLNRIWNYVGFTDCPSRKNFRTLKHLPFKRLQVRDFQWHRLPVEIIRNIPTLRDLVFNSWRDRLLPEIQALKDCNFTFHISTYYIPPSTDTCYLANLLRKIANVRLSIETYYPPYTLTELQWLTGIPIDRLNSNAVCLCNQNKDLVTIFIQTIEHLKPASVILGRSPRCCAETGLLAFNESDLDVLYTWPIKKFYTGLFGYPHAERPPIQLMEKLLNIPTLETIYVEHECSEDTKKLCIMRTISIRLASVNPYF